MLFYEVLTSQVFTPKDRDVFESVGVMKITHSMIGGAYHMDLPCFDVFIVCSG